MRKTMLVQALLLLTPWPLRRRLLEWFFGYSLAKTARIGFSIVAPKYLEMADGANIGHLTLVRGMDTVRMAKGAGISHLNWIYGVPGDASYFPRQPDRRAELIIDEGGGLTRRHLVDCTHTVRIGKYAMVAGYSTQILTHSVDVESGIQWSKPISIGAYSMVGTRCVILGGAELPGYSVLGAGSMLRGAFRETHRIYSGVPAEAGPHLARDARYFQAREDGEPAHRLPGQPSF